MTVRRHTFLPLAVCLATAVIVGACGGPAPPASAIGAPAESAAASTSAIAR